MSDHVDRAAEVIYVEGMGLTAYSPTAVDDHNRHSYRGDCDCNHNDRRAARMTAQALDAAGMLVTPEHDATVAARALREAADEVARMLADDSGCELNAEMLVSLRNPGYLMAWLRVRASERDGGETDADA